MRSSADGTCAASPADCPIGERLTGILTTAQWRPLLPGQISQLCAIDVETAEITVILESDRLVLESPNWSPDGHSLVVNAAGALYRVDIAESRIDPISTGTLDDHNNDHLISPDGGTIYTSSEVSGRLYAVPFAGGEPRQLTPDHEEPFGHFLQGVSPDGRTLSVTGADARPGRPFASDLYLFSLDDGSETRLSEWEADSLGCDYSPDGRWLYLNSERDAERPGHMQLYRMHPDATGLERLVHSETADWFPRVSPSGEWFAYLSFPPGTIGHGANVHVVLNRARPDGSERSVLAELFGGQGTMNVNSWAPDGRRFAFVRYPIEGTSQ
jgi:Tol biopolymer transport system component